MAAVVNPPPKLPIPRIRMGIPMAAVVTPPQVAVAVGRGRLEPWPAVAVAVGCEKHLFFFGWTGMVETRNSGFSEKNYQSCSSEVPMQ